MVKVFFANEENVCSAISYGIENVIEVVVGQLNVHHSFHDGQ